MILFGFLILASEGVRADDPYDQSKSAAAVWQRAQVGKLGPFLNDPYLVVPLDIPSQALTHQKAVVETSLKSFVPNTSPGNHVQILADGRYVLYGDLFKTGDIYALVQLPVAWEIDPYWNGGRLAFAQLIKGDWQLRGLWDISTVWESKEQAETNTEHLPVKPAESPFELVDFDQDGVPEVIMAGEVWKYYQNYYLLRFDAKTQSLQMLASAMDKPELCDGYVRLYFNSGHRSIFEEWVFAKLTYGKMEKIASWHDGAPYNPGDDEGLRVEALNKKGEMETFKIDDVPASPLHSRYEITRDRIKVATITFLLKKPVSSDAQLEDRLEKAWLFHHITGLPEDILSPHGKAVPLPPFSEYENVEISGNSDFIRRLNNF